MFMVLLCLYWSQFLDQVKYVFSMYFRCTKKWMNREMQSHVSVATQISTPCTTHSETTNKRSHGASMTLFEAQIDSHYDQGSKRSNFLLLSYWTCQRLQPKRCTTNGETASLYWWSLATLLWNRRKNYSMSVSIRSFMLWVMEVQSRMTKKWYLWLPFILKHTRVLLIVIGKIVSPRSSEGSLETFSVQNQPILQKNALGIAVAMRFL